MRILITGASGQLGSYLLRELRDLNMPAIAWSGARHGDIFGYPLQSVDLADPEQIKREFQKARPDVVIHAGAISTVAACWQDPRQAEVINTLATGVLTDLAAQADTRLLFLSTDLVFNGEKGWYRETDLPSPLSVYGRSKFAAEQLVLPYSAGVVIRLSLLVGPTLLDRPGFFDNQVAGLRAGRAITLFEDEWRTPLGLTAAARAVLVLANSNFVGLLHLGGPERVSRLEMGRRLALFLGANPSVIVAAKRNSAVLHETRPRDVSLDSSRWRELFPSQAWPDWTDAFQDQEGIQPS
jgi:dTDP-4-dehydrorhamnose reductase